VFKKKKNFVRIASPKNQRGGGPRQSGKPEKKIKRIIQKKKKKNKRKNKNIKPYQNNEPKNFFCFRSEKKHWHQPAGR